MSDKSKEITLISHPSVVWPGARELRTAADGFLLCISRNPLRGAAARLVEEGYGPATTLIIRDNFDAAPDQRSTIAEALKV